MKTCDRCSRKFSILDLCSIELSVSEHPNLCDPCWRAVRDFAYGRGRVEEKKAAFDRAALEYCRLWTRDMRNANDATRVLRDLDRSRGVLHEAYRALVESEESASKKEDA